MGCVLPSAYVDTWFIFACFSLVLHHLRGLNIFISIGIRAWNASWVIWWVKVRILVKKQDEWGNKVSNCIVWWKDELICVEEFRFKTYWFNKALMIHLKVQSQHLWKKGNECLWRRRWALFNLTLHPKSI